MTRMSWEMLLNGSRYKESTSEKAKSYYNEFDKDYSRIAYSSSVRRLQGKAQVFPLQENDFTRTRLTHSIEVASLGESLAWNIGDKLIKRGGLKNVWEVKELASMVKTASLVHDLGNPPFGHYGENVISEWFKKWFKDNEEYKNQLSKTELEDLQNFEGNAQSLRILTKLQILNNKYAVNFTYGTLATLIKYPWSSTSKEVTGNNNENENDNENENENENEKKMKFGYFSSEKEVFERICKETGIGPHRHPATLIMEAADDIAYLPTDIEDGIKKGVIRWYEIEHETGLLKLLENEYNYAYKNLEKKNDEAESNKVPDIELAKAQNLKIVIQGIFIKEAVDIFLNNYESIMKGTFTGGLLENSPVEKLVKKCKEISGDYIFNSNEVLSLELVGDKVISELLDFFVTAVINTKEEASTKTKSEKLYHLISNNYRYVFNSEEDKSIKEQSLYKKLLLVTDFISGMTDNYALNLHQELLGVKMP